MMKLVSWTACWRLCSLVLPSGEKEVHDKQVLINRHLQNTSICFQVFCWTFCHISCLEMEANELKAFCCSLKGTHLFLWVWLLSLSLFVRLFHFGGMSTGDPTNCEWLLVHTKEECASSGREKHQFIDLPQLFWGMFTFKYIGALYKINVHSVPLTDVLLFIYCFENVGSTVVILSTFWSVTSWKSQTEKLVGKRFR